MMVFYKKNITFLSENAINADKRRYLIADEAPRHFIDLDAYEDHGLNLPPTWKEVLKVFLEDSLKKHGILPWHLQLMKYRLTEAFKNQDASAILKLSADIGHYAGDANVPLHTTRNYNGQFTNQHGIHGFWESRLPELHFKSYDFFTGKATYINKPTEHIWEIIRTSHNAVDSVLRFEKNLSVYFEEDKKYTFEERGNTVVKAYSREYAEAYHKALNGQVERQFRSAIKFTADLWYTCWVDGGKPDMRKLLEFDFSVSEKEEMEKEKSKLKDAGSCDHKF